MTAVPEVVEFLLTYPPFSALGHAEVESAAASAEIEFHLAGTEIFSQDAEPSDVLRVIRAGAVEIVHDGRVLDQIGVGEMFGHASMLSGLPTGFAARAAEDTLTYRIPADAAYHLLGQPATLRYVTRSLLQDRYGIRQGRATEVERNHLSQPVGALIRSPAVICPPDTPIRDAAREMSASGATSVVVELGSSLGILTDRDLRSPRARRRPVPGRPGLGGDDGPGRHGPGRAPRRRGPLGHARPGIPPLPGPLGDR